MAQAACSPTAAQEVAGGEEDENSTKMLEESLETDPSEEKAADTDDPAEEETADTDHYASILEGTLDTIQAEEEDVAAEADDETDREEAEEDVPIQAPPVAQPPPAEDDGDDYASILEGSLDTIEAEEEDAAAETDDDTETAETEEDWFAPFKAILR